MEKIIKNEEWAKRIRVKETVEIVVVESGSFGKIFILMNTNVDNLMLIIFKTITIPCFCVRVTKACRIEEIQHLSVMHVFIVLLFSSES